MKRLHLALGVADISFSIKEYTSRLGQIPIVIIKDKYALFRTDTLNVSIRKVDSSEIGLRHLGWEDSTHVQFVEEADCNGITWEYFSKNTQIKEILDVWPTAKKNNTYLQSPDEVSY